MTHILKTQDLLLGFYKILHRENGQEAHGSYYNGFSKKNLIWAIWTILDLEMKRP